MLVDVENCRDFLQYYGGSYIKGKDGRIYFCFPNQDRLAVGSLFGPRSPRSNETSLAFAKSEDNKWAKCRLTWEELVATLYFGLPVLGTIALNNELLFFSYDPNRNGGRGLDVDRLHAYSFNRPELIDHGLSPFETNHISALTNTPKLPRQLLFPRRVSLKKAWDGLTRAEQPKIAAALDVPKFGLFNSAYHANPVLTYRDRKVAEVDRQALHLLLDGNPIKALITKSFPEYTCYEYR